jgi:hypothetical protein
MLKQISITAAAARAFLQGMRACRAALDALTVLTGIASQCGVEAAQQRFAFKRLAQKADGTPSQHLGTDFVIGKSCDENNRYVMPTPAQSVV